MAWLTPAPRLEGIGGLIGLATGALSRSWENDVRPVRAVLKLVDRHEGVNCSPNMAIDPWLLGVIADLPAAGELATVEPSEAGDSSAAGREEAAS
jgi:hypothetical protein